MILDRDVGIAAQLRGDLRQFLLGDADALLRHRKLGARGVERARGNP